MADIPRGTSTPVTIRPGEDVKSTINRPGDRDWIRLDVDKGGWVQVDLIASGARPLGDPYLRVYDAAGKLIIKDDDGGALDYDSSLMFHALGDGPYYIEASGLDGDYTGTYLLQTTVIPPPSAHESLFWGTQQPDTDITVHFVPEGETLEGYTSDGWTAAEIAQFSKVFARISAVADLDFTITDDPDADLRLVIDTDEFPTKINDTLLGFFNPPGERNAGVGVFNGAAWDRNGGGDLRPGGNGFVTMGHELLHGLGLAHPHDDGGVSKVMPGVTSDKGDFGYYNLNQGVFTTMSYNTGYQTGDKTSAPRSDTFGHEAGPMALDIAVLQELYGARANETGNNTYLLHGANRAGTKWECIWDTGGDDMLRFDGTLDATINLRAATLIQGAGAGGFISKAAGIAGGYTIAHGATIENARSGSGDDRLIGNGTDNMLLSGAGHDRLSGRGGDDDLRTGRGNDRAWGGSGDDLIRGDRGRDMLHGGAGADQLRGDGENDILIGARGDDVLVGGWGHDVLTGGAGRDVLTGGSGGDTFTFKSASDSGTDPDSRDTITDFVSGQDLIDLSAIDADLTRRGNQDFTFIGRQGFDAAGDLRFMRTEDNCLLQADRDGDGSVDFTLLLSDISALKASDFIL